jgi:hypothetical protein
LWFFVLVGAEVEDEPNCQLQLWSCTATAV